MESKFAQQALEAWWSAQPDGVLLPVSKISGAITALEVPLPRKEILRIFKSFCDDGAESIPFLVFWKAWAHLARLQDKRIKTDESYEDHLFLELQTFRDTLLRFSAVSRRDFPVSYLIQETEKAHKMSDFPAFWDMCVETMRGLAIPEENAPASSEDKTSLEDVTVILISWLLEAISFHRERGLAAAKERDDATKKERELAQNQGLPVHIHIYDVSQESVIRKLNRVTANKFSPLKFGGVFHAGVEVAQLEWSYGATMVDTMSGIVCHESKTHPQHRYRQTVFMGFTSFTAEEVADLISEMVELYPGWDYDLLRRNCCHFADDMCQRMGVGRIPGWIYRFARVGAGVDTMIMAIKNLRGGKKDDEDVQNAITNG